MPEQKVQIGNKYLLIIIGVILAFGIYLGSQWKAESDLTKILEAEKAALMLEVAASDKIIERQDSMITENSKYISGVHNQINELKLKRNDEKVKATADTITVFSTHVSSIADSIIALY